MCTYISEKSGTGIAIEPISKDDMQMTYDMNCFSQNKHGMTALDFQKKAAYDIRITKWMKVQKCAKSSEITELVT